MIYPATRRSPVPTELDNPELTPEDRLNLLAEQARIERLACFQEITALRALLDRHRIGADQVTGWLDRSDSILDTLLRYGEGHYGRINQREPLYLPYSWRRKARKLLTGR